MVWIWRARAIRTHGNVPAVFLGTCELRALGYESKIMGYDNGFDDENHIYHLPGTSYQSEELQAQNTMTCDQAVVLNTIGSTMLARREANKTQRTQ